LFLEDEEVLLKIDKFQVSEKDDSSKLGFQSTEKVEG
jgi:hypothetical protein